MNDELLHRIGGWWLDFGRWGQTAVVLALLALTAYFAFDAFNRRRSAYRAAVRAADITRPETTHGEIFRQPEHPMRGTP